MDDQRDHILKWIDSVGDTAHTKYQFEHSRKDTYNPPPKRRRLRHDTEGRPHTFVQQYNTAAVFPDTPPLTLSDSSGHKRASGAIDEDDSGIDPADTTPRAKSTHVPNIARPNSPTKLNRGLLQMFEKPIHVKNLESNIESLPEDIRPLYRCIRNKTYHGEEIIPHEVREQVLALLGEDGVREYNFCREATEGAEALHDALCDIGLDAKMAAEHNYHEAGWNHCVHTPLLKLIFTSRPWGQQQHPPGHTRPADPPRGRPTRTRVVPVMSTAIVPAYLPAKRSRLSNLTMSATDLFSGSGPESWTSSASSTTSSGTGQTYSSRGDSKKVDYVLVMDTADSTPLRDFFSVFAYEEALEQETLPHVNHVMYQPLQWSPIACSIETKVEATATDPMLQLGTWVGSWHKRMGALRRYLLDKVPSLQANPLDDRLASTLLIEVVNHEWRLYFACDQGVSIALFGPLSIGSTKDTREAYTLVAVLRAIREWTETTFYESLERWFFLQGPGSQTGWLGHLDSFTL